MTSAFLDYFRCPEEFAKFGAAGETGPETGFFRFGNRITCYGRSSGDVVPAPDGQLPDSLPLTQFRKDEIQLPFDVDEIVENLRRERYVAPEKTSSRAKNAIEKLYYAIRPLLSVGVRKHFQRYHLRERTKIPFPQWPVDKTVDHLCAQLMSFSVHRSAGQGIPFVWFWPDDYMGCVLMTHDVEHEQGRRFCGQLMDLDERHGVRASFQVVPEERYSVSPAFLESIRARGFELNVHDLNHDGRLFRSHEYFLNRARKINQYGQKWRSDGYRSGGMYRNAEWIDALRFSYEMSFPTAAHLEPQIGGCCTVMPYFLGGLIELPLTTTQDYSLFHILGQYSIDLWKQEMASIAESNGLASFIIHPDYIIERRARRVYEELLQHLRESCSKEKLWQPLPGQAANWWRERSQMRVEHSGGAWKVTGPGSERARVAFAQVEDGRLTYHVESAPCRESVV